jgi:hypothetical protein
MGSLSKQEQAAREKLCAHQGGQAIYEARKRVVDFAMGNGPGNPATRVKVKKGDRIELPFNLRSFVERNGLTYVDVIDPVDGEEGPVETIVEGATPEGVDIPSDDTSDDPAAKGSGKKGK